MAKKKKSRAREEEFEKQSPVYSLGGLRVSTEPKKALSDSEKAELEFLEGFLDDSQLKILRGTGIYHDIGFENDTDLDDLIDNTYAVAEQLPPVDNDIVHTEPEPMAIVANRALLSSELRYIETLLEPTEFRALLSELYYDLAGDVKLTHYDLSDIVCSAVSPSRIKDALRDFDDQQPYCSGAQYVQAYNCLRYVSPLLSTINYYHIVRSLVRTFNELPWTKPFGLVIDENEDTRTLLREQPGFVDHYFYDPDEQ